MKRPSEKTQKLLTYVGGYIMLLPNGITWYWGNISVYVYSFFHHKNQSLKMNANHDVKAPWLLSLHIISMSTAIMVSGYINNRIGRRPTLLLGIAMFDGGLVASYFVFGYSMSMLDVTMGIVCGVGNGFIHAMILQTYVEWTTKHLGLVTAFLLTSYAIGSVVSNQLITHYLNPDNKKVDVKIGKTHFFSQEDIIDRVPCMFPALSTVCGICHLIAFSLIRVKQMTPELKGDGHFWKKKKTSIVPADTNNNGKVSFNLPRPKTLISRSDQNLDKLGTIQVCSNSGYRYESMEDACKWPDSDDDDDYDDVNRPRSVSYSDNHVPLITDDSVNINSVNNPIEKSPLEVLKSRFFYVLWFVIFGTDGAFITLSNYYKVFGQVWIKDDHFLTTIGTFFAIFFVAMRLVWGFLTDFIRLKPALVTFTSGLALISAGYVFTASLNKWLFLASTVLIGGINCGIYVNFIVAMHSMYGKVNFAKNFGLLSSATIILNLVFPPLTKLLLSHFGWCSLFFFISSLNLCSLVLIVCILPD